MVPLITTIFNQMSTFSIIIAEDDKWYSDFLKYQLELIPEYRVTTVASGKELFSALRTNRPDLVTLDYNLPDISGEKALSGILEESPETAVIVVSGQDDIGIAVSLLKKGASDYLVKDVETKERLWKAVANVREKQALRTQIDELREEVGKKYDFEKSLVGQSPAFKKVYKLMEKACSSSINVSITGETGTGKEMIAKAIHYNSDRKKAPFVAVNISAIPKDLIESELFGHEKGAFTGAIAQRIGKFEEAKNGTLFIDEVGELDLNTQVKLLRVLQEREIQRVGGNSPIKMKCRILTATHKDLKSEVANGNFRQDLFFRLIGLPVSLPPLRERKEDILLLVKHFCQLYAKENRVKPLSLSEEAKTKLLEYDYPGNVRELKSVIELACVMCDEEAIRAEDISFLNSKSISDLMSQSLTLKQITRHIILQSLEDANNNVGAVARKLDIGKSTIYRILKEEPI